jgi:hypothetical protein
MGTITTYEESGTWTGRRPHPHNGYSSGYSPTRDQWREPSPTSPTTNVARRLLTRGDTL